MMLLRSCAALALSLGLLVNATPGQAQAGCAAHFDGQRYTLIVPNRAGGGFDAYARAFAPVFEEVTGATMIVVNQPAGGGLVGVTNVARAEEGDNMLGFFGSNDVVGIEGLDPESLTALGAITIDQETWVGRAGLTIDDVIGKPLVSGTSSLDSDLTVVVLAGRAMGTPVTPVSGYGGSVETAAAILRGEIDLASRTLGTAMIQAATGDFTILLSVTDGPVAEVEGLPYLAGPGGVVDRLTKDIAPAEREKRMADAMTAVALNKHMRAVYATSGLSEARQECLATAIEEVLMGDALPAAVAELGRPYNPLPFAEANAFMRQMIDAYAGSDEILEEMRALVSNQ